jgi:hypothetical protein
MEKFTSNNTGIDPFVRNNNDATSARFGHLNAIVDNLNNNINSGTYTPTISDESNVEVTLENDLLFTKIGDIVTVSGFFSIAFDSGSSGSFKFDLAESIRPDNNWANIASPISIITPISIVTIPVGNYIVGVDSTKLLEFFVKTTLGAEFGIFFSTTYKITN